VLNNGVDICDVLAHHIWAYHGLLPFMYVHLHMVRHWWMTTLWYPAAHLHGGTWKVKQHYIWVIQIRNYNSMKQWIYVKWILCSLCDIPAQCLIGLIRILIPISCNFFSGSPSLKTVTPDFPKKTKCIPICMPGSSFMHIVTYKWIHKQYHTRKRKIIRDLHFILETKAPNITGSRLGVAYA
jgi:hypothetical protein